MDGEAVVIHCGFKGEVASNIFLRFSNKLEAKNKIIWAWWGAEEEGLLGTTFQCFKVIFQTKGSRAYLRDLSDKEINEIAVGLNMDMTASPNYAPWVFFFLRKNFLLKCLLNLETKKKL